ncbi:MAG: TonB family protein [Terracidiphilus sp.]|jgi:TonB family protein
MRRILATSLLLPSLFLPAAVNASSLVDDAAASAPKVRVSTGVIAPKLLHPDQITIRTTGAESTLPADAQVGLSLTVDESGRPQNVKVVQSLNPLWDARVVEAISRSQFKPGTVDKQPTPVDLNLTVNIAR